MSCSRTDTFEAGKIESYANHISNGSLVINDKNGRFWHSSFNHKKYNLALQS